MSESLLKEVAVKTQELFEALENAHLNLSFNEKEDLKALVKRPVGLRDTAQFNIAVNMPSKQHIKELRRELAQSISAEKFKEGFVFAMQLLSAVGGI